MLGFLSRFVDSNDRELKRIQPFVDAANELETEIQALSDEEIRARFAEIREEVAESDVQLLGGVVLHQGKIAEMKTGEGKTFLPTLAAALNAMAGRGVHIVTVNDYLARRDPQWMGTVFHFLGLSVGM